MYLYTWSDMYENVLFKTISYKHVNLFTDAHHEGSNMMKDKLDIGCYQGFLSYKSIVA